MTRNQAIDLDNELKEYLQSVANSKNIGNDVGAYLVDNFVEFFPEENIKGMIFLGGNAASYKLGNVKIDLRKALTNIVEYAVSVNKPENVFENIQLIMLSVLFIYKSIRQDLGQIESYLVYFLHTRGVYGFGIEEEQFILEVAEWYQQKTKKMVKRSEIVEAINHLYAMKVADFENGNVVLKEKVWGEM